MFVLMSRTKQDHLYRVCLILMRQGTIAGSRSQCARLEVDCGLDGRQGPQQTRRSIPIVVLADSRRAFVDTARFQGRIMKLIHSVTGCSRKGDVKTGARRLGILSPLNDAKGRFSFEPRRPVTNRADIFKEAHIAERSENCIVESGRAFEAAHAKGDMVEQSYLQLPQQ